jgi:hypothetical protein
MAEEVKTLDYYKPDGPRLRARPVFRAMAALLAIGGLLASANTIYGLFFTTNRYPQLLVLVVLNYSTFICGSVAWVGRPLWLLTTRR